MRSELIRALKAHATGHIAKHKANVEIYLNHPVGIGEHPDVIEAVEKEGVDVNGNRKKIMVRGRDRRERRGGKKGHARSRHIPRQKRRSSRNTSPQSYPQRCCSRRPAHREPPSKVTSKSPNPPRCYSPCWLLAAEKDCL